MSRDEDQILNFAPDAPDEDAAVVVESFFHKLQRISMETDSTEMFDIEGLFDKPPLLFSV